MRRSDLIKSFATQTAISAIMRMHSGFIDVTGITRHTQRRPIQGIRCRLPPCQPETFQRLDPARGAHESIKTFLVFTVP